jgi:hypothetical protein
MSTSYDISIGNISTSPCNVFMAKTKSSIA